MNPESPPPQRDPESQATEDAKAFAGGCLAGMGAVGMVVTTVVLVVLGLVVVAVFLVFLACSGAFG